MGTNSPEYQLQYRAENPEYMENQRKRAQARTAAMKRLKELHLADYEWYLAEELKLRGL